MSDFIVSGVGIGFDSRGNKLENQESCMVDCDE